jgi:AAA domain, putative AbiEii toxin, Type IV TA system/AAA ATPase domain
MLSKVDIKNYRGFPSYRMEGLAQVNLLVGKNNSGKSALLEAIQFLASGGHPGVLEEAANRRGELNFDRDRPTPYMLVDVGHLFYGHRVAVGSSWKVTGDNGYPAVELTIAERDGQRSLLEDQPIGRPIESPYEVHISGGQAEIRGTSRFRLSVEGGADFSRARRMGLIPNLMATNSRFLSNESLDSDSLAEMWDNIVFSAKEGEVCSALRLLDPAVTSIHPLTGTLSSNMKIRRGGFLVGMDNKSRIPLGSLGDGMRRMLALAVSLAQARNEAIFIDEIDTGLHYSVMQDMWKLVIKRAIASDVQVFATTHSWDCIEGLSLLCQDDPSVLDKVAVHKIDRTLERSIPFLGDSIARMERNQIDPR